MHSSRMRTVHSSSRLPGGGMPQCMLGYTHRGPGPGQPGPGPGNPPKAWAWKSPGQTLQPPLPGPGPRHPPGRLPNLPLVPGPKHPLCEQNDWQTGEKTLPSQTSFADG